MRSPERPDAAPPRSEAASSGERRALAARLLRLPDGHPSSLRGDGADGDWQPEAAREEPQSADQAEEIDDAVGQEDQDYADEPDYASDPDDPGDVDQPGFDPPGAPESVRRAVGRPSVGGTGGGREPYRPWFADGEPGSPWFADDL